ncbi:hypothetical protein TRVA0_009S02894 [Trichomonascus vanleenenianus]|uniref:F-box protein n=1 Tax=Trichomonascus vanleenenianus TaxID=2268995 RepID=UPI003ECB1F4B
MITSLPIEIWEQIVKYSRPEDVSNLHLTCRLINEISLWLLWRKVNILAGNGSLENAAFRYQITDEIAELLGRYMDHIRVLSIDMGQDTFSDSNGDPVSDCKSLPKILSLLWNKASEITHVIIAIQEVFYLESFVKKWVDICTSLSGNCNPSVELYYDCRLNSNGFHPGLQFVEDVLSAGRELLQSLSVSSTLA